MEKIDIPSFIKEKGYYIDLRNISLDKTKKIDAKVKIKNKKKKILFKTSFGVIAIASFLALFSTPQKIKNSSNINASITLDNKEDFSKHGLRIVSTKKPRRGYRSPGIEEDELERKKHINDLKKLEELANNNEISRVDFSEIINENNDYVGIDKELVNDRIDKLDTYFSDVEETYGVDKNILISIGMQESNLNNNIKSEHAKGIMQIENVNHDSTYKSYNYNLGKEESVNFSKLNLSNVADNIKAGTVMFKNTLKKFDYNILFALQSYNYGVVPMNKAIEYAVKELGKDKYSLTYSEVLPYIEYIHKNPRTTIDKNWKYKTYGDPIYSINVSKYSNSRIIYNKTVDNSNNTRLTIYDLVTGRAIKKYIKADELYIDLDTNEKIRFENILSSIEEYNNLKQNKL